MQGIKGLVIAATIVATAAALGACRKEVRHETYKLGGDVTQTEVAR